MDFTLSYSPRVQDSQQAYQLAKDSLNPSRIAKYKFKIDFSFYPDEKKIVANGKGFLVKIDFDEDHCRGKVALSLWLRPLQTNILKMIKRHLKRAL